MPIDDDHEAIRLSEEIDSIYVNARARAQVQCHSLSSEINRRVDCCIQKRGDIPGQTQRILTIADQERVKIMVNYHNKLQAIDAWRSKTIENAKRYLIRKYRGTCEEGTV